MQTLDATAVRRWCRAGLARLEEARAEIDAINVYPVADGDTGSNLCSTMLAVVRQLDGQDGDHEQQSPGDLAGTLRTITHAALLGARGNSGVILSQMLRGMADVLADDGQGPPDGGALARALTRAADLGYQAVGEPVEGTVLTVARAAARAASEVASAGGALTDVAEAAVEGARKALAGTSDQLGVLHDAGVVDAGGRGLLVLVEALAGVLRDDEPDEDLAARWAEPDDQVGRATGLDQAAVFAPQGPARPDGPSYEVMYLLDATAERVITLRGELSTLGDSLVVVGDEELWNVHVHVPDPGAAVEAGMRAGRPHRVRITYLGDGTTATAMRERHVVAVAPGDGLAKVLVSAGATVVRSRPDEAPAVEELRVAIHGACAPEVVVLPDGEHARALAEAVAEQARATGLRLAVLPTRAAVQVLAALAVHDAGRDFDDDVVAMTAAARSTRRGEICVATGEAVTSAGVCSPGDVLGLVEGDVAVIGSVQAEAACAVVDRLLSAGGELVTLVSGRGADPGMVDRVVAHLREARPDVETVTYEGDQPHYPLLVGVE